LKTSERLVTAEAAAIEACMPASEELKYNRRSIQQLRLLLNEYLLSAVAMVTTLKEDQNVVQAS